MSSYGRESSEQRRRYNYRNDPPRTTHSTDGQRKHGRNAAHRRPPLFFPQLGLTRRQELLLVSTIVTLMAAWFLTPLSDVVAGWVLLSVPIDSDVELGREALVALREKYPPASDRWRVGSVGWDLVDALKGAGIDAGFASEHSDWQRERNKYRWSFEVVSAPFENAFALPGGIVRVTDSLLKTLDLTDAELAALIGHEMGHVLHRHSQKRMVKKQLLGTVIRALTYEDGDDYDETFGEAVGEILLKGAAWIGEQGFSRRDEYQADEASWNILVASKTYDPRAVESLLGKLWSLQGGSGETSWESTHPGTKDRIAALRDKWNGLSRKEQRQLARFPVS